MLPGRAAGAGRGADLDNASDKISVAQTQLVIFAVYTWHLPHGTCSPVVPELRKVDALIGRARCQLLTSITELSRGTGGDAGRTACAQLGSMCGGERLRHAAAAALPHINLLLAVYSGAALAMSARLKWDPSIYILLRELLPAEYSAAAVALPTLALVLLLLGHLALAATFSCRRLLYVYAALMMALAIGEIVFMVWAWQRVEEWLRSPEAAAAAELQRELAEHLWPLLRALQRLYPLPSKVSDLIAEVRADMPRNGYVAGGAVLLLLVLQLTGAIAAFLLATRRPTESANASRKRPSSITHDYAYENLAPHSSHSSHAPPLRPRHAP